MYIKCRFRTGYHFSLPQFVDGIFFLQTEGSDAIDHLIHVMIIA